jgi:pimeloyl-ACP methyl ester carboxylesterase
MMKQTLLYKNGNSRAYAEYGDKSGYPILVQHGLIASIEDYDLFDRLIQLGTHLICIARPGYGDSSPYLLRNFAEWSDIVEVLADALHLSQFDILGMSSGAPYSYSIAYKFPDRVRNIFIFSGIPALYHADILSLWPYKRIMNESMAELEKLAHELFFSRLSGEDLNKNDIIDSMMNNCFGVAQDLRLRFQDWGFTLSEVKENVYMEHSKDDANVPFETAVITSGLLPHCNFTIRESGGHFSNEALDEFIKTVMVEYYSS